MFNSIPSLQTSVPGRHVFEALRNTPTTLPVTEHRKLQEHLDDCNAALGPQSTLLAYVLANKLMNTRPVADGRRNDQAVGGCLVSYAIDGAAPLRGLLVHSAQTGAIEGAIPVASLLGATLIGMQTGQQAPLLRQDGSIGKLVVTNVEFASES